jgi:Ca-activated chloride channel family protein
MRSRMTITLAVALCAATFIHGGSSTLGRLSLAFGQPWLAAHLLDDPYWKGVALYRQGRFEEAAEIFRGVGKPGFYNRANALARLGRYSEAVAYYDAVLFYAPNDDDARTNRALVDALVEKAEIQTSVQGSILPEGAAKEMEADGRTQGGLSDAFVAEAEQEKVRHVFSGQAIIASREWLATLTDEPGRYLKRRIAAEHERRLKLGIGMSAESDRW